MKLLVILLISTFLLQVCQAELSLPPDIAHAISKSSSGESGGLYVHGTDRKRFLEYICANWRVIADNIEQLPKADPDGGSFNSEQDSFNAAVDTFSTACEWLPPEEYVDFLNKLADLYEQKRIGYLALGFQLGGNAKKESFLDVNWNHPRVQAFLVRVKPLIPKTEIGVADGIDQIVRGEHAESYMVNKSDDAPLPETLPGVKLKRPFASMIKKFEKLTGKRVSTDPRFPQESSTLGEKRSGESPILEAWWTVYSWKWLLFGGALVVSVASAFKFRHGNTQSELQ